jgi:hypothetical protein
MIDISSTMIPVFLFEYFLAIVFVRRHVDPSLPFSLPRTSWLVDEPTDSVSLISQRTEYRSYPISAVPQRHEASFPDHEPVL